MEGPVVVDASPLIAFASIGRLDLLQSVFGMILVPPVVVDEVRPSIAVLPGWIQVDHRDLAPALARLPIALDPGERAAIALALQCSARVIVVDDLDGRRAARALGLTLTGTFGVVDLARSRGTIQKARPVLDRLIATGLHVNYAIYAEILQRAGEPIPDDHPFRVPGD